MGCFCLLHKMRGHQSLQILYSNDSFILGIESDFIMLNSAMWMYVLQTETKGLVKIR